MRMLIALVILVFSICGLSAQSDILLGVNVVFEYEDRGTGVPPSVLVSWASFAQILTVVEADKCKAFRLTQESLVHSNRYCS